mgnify:FL=1
MYLYDNLRYLCILIVEADHIIIYTLHKYSRSLKINFLSFFPYNTNIVQWQTQRHILALENSWSKQFHITWQKKQFYTNIYGIFQTKQQT